MGARGHEGSRTRYKAAGSIAETEPSGRAGQNADDEDGGSRAPPPAGILEGRWRDYGVFAPCDQQAVGFCEARLDRRVAVTRFVFRAGRQTRWLPLAGDAISPPRAERN